jgi:hypothetical protein
MDVMADPQMVEFLRELNLKDVPVDAWPNMRDCDGYWMHNGNMDEGRRNIFAILDALAKKNIDVESVGLDLEPPLAVLKDGKPMRGICTEKPWLPSPAKAEDKLRRLIEEMLGAGHGVDTYEVPVLSDYALPRRLFGIPQAPLVHPSSMGQHRRVGMVYTSVTPGMALMGGPESFVRDYSAGRERMPALGIVSATGKNPGRKFGDTEPYFLDDRELARDIEAALSVSPKELFIFALNGLQVVERVNAAIAKVKDTNLSAQAQ